jgi:hypothetical protein
MTFETPEKATMAPRSGEKRDRLSDNTDQPAASPNPKDLKFLGAGDNAEKIGSNGKDPIEIEDSPPKSDETPMDFDETELAYEDDEKAPSVVKLIASGGLDDEVNGYEDDDANTPRSLLTRFDNAQALEAKLPDSDDDEDTHKLANAIMQEDDDDAMDMDEDKDTEFPVTSEYNKDNQTNDNKKNQKNKNKQDHHSTNHNDHTGNINHTTSNTTTVLSLKNLKTHTSKWTTLSQQSKNLMPYIDTDRENALMDMDNCLLKWDGIDKDTATKDQWASAFDKSYKARKGHKGGLIKLFGIKLAGTKPSELFLDSEFDGTNLFGSPIANAWAGAYIFYGPAWNPQRVICLDISHGPAKPTNMWINLSEAETNSAPFRPSEIFADNPRSMHDLERLYRSKLKLPKSPVEIDPLTWMKSFSTHKNNPEVFSTVIKLAITPISVFSKDTFADPKQKKLTSSAVTNFWAGAYRLLGAPWAHVQEYEAKTNFEERNQRVAKEAPPSHAIATSANHPDTKATKSPMAISDTDSSFKATSAATEDKGISFAAGTRTSGLFISRPPRKFVPPVKPKADARKHEAVYYTVILQEIEVDWRDAGPAAIASFLEVTDHIFAKDKKARILGFQNDSVAPFTKKSVPMKTKSALKRYFSNGFFQTGKRPVGRIRVSHDIEPGLIEIEEGIQFSVTHEVIQEKDKTNIGFLVGSMPNVANLEDMREAHGNHIILKSLKMVLVNEPIKLTSGKSPIAWKEQVSAIHILVGESQSILARTKYNEVYGSRNKGGYPQGVQMRFVPAIDDQRYPVTPSMKMKTIKMMCKQKVFLTSLATISTTTIAGLHHYIPKLGYNLCQILMAMKSFKSPAMGLFISIDEEIIDQSYNVTFTSHVDRESEAKSLVPLLCLVLEAKFGYRIWEWFTNDAKKASSQWRWDADISSLVPRVSTRSADQDDGMGIDSDDEYTMSMCDLHNVDTTVSGDGFEFDLAFVISEENLNDAPNQFGDTGSVKTFREECQTEDTFPMVDTEKHPNARPAPSTTNAHVQAPDDMTVDADESDSFTREPSTITDATEDVEKSLEALMISHPELVRKLLTKTSKNKLNDNNQKSTAVSPNEGVDGR